jgi:VanZ family protein
MWPLVERDVLANVAIYVPLGVSAWFFLRRRLGAGQAAVAATAFGALLSLTAEYVQRWQPLRVPTLVDALANIAGTAIGVGIAATAAGWTRHRHRTGQGIDTAALSLLVVMAAWLLFPFVPISSQAELQARSSAFLHAGTGVWLRAVSMTAVWLSAGHMLAAVLRHNSLTILRASTLLIPARVMLSGSQPQWTDFAGALAGCVLFASRVPLSATAALLILVVAIRGLAPGSGEAAGTFVWLPFGGFLGQSWSAAASTLLEKLVFYGGTIWSVARCGVNGRFATGGIAILLGAIEALQVWIPGRTPEITDPILAILLGLLLVMNQRSRSPR